MKISGNRAIRFFIAALIAAGLGAAAGQYAGPVVFQEGNPLPVAWAALKLEITGAEIVYIDDDRTRLIQMAGPEEPLSRFLAAEGWRYKDRLGAGIFYEKNGLTLLANARMLSRRYVVYELNRGP